MTKICHTSTRRTHARAFTLAHTHTYILANRCVFIYGYDL